MKTIASRIALGISLTATALAGAAYAQQAGKPDHTVTRAEAQAKAQERFARMDANKDGKLDRADHAARQAARFDRIDADKNGQISRAEFDAQRGPEGRGPEAGRGPGADHGPGKHRWGGRGGYHGREPGMAGGLGGANLDANKDGAVTQAEFTHAALQRFDRSDANKDGTVTGEERRAARQAMREQMRQHWQDRAGQANPPKTN